MSSVSESSSLSYTLSCRDWEIAADDPYEGMSADEIIAFWLSAFLKLYKKTGHTYTEDEVKTDPILKMQLWNFIQLYPNRLPEAGKAYKSLSREMGITEEIRCVQDKKFQAAHRQVMLSKL